MEENVLLRMEGICKSFPGVKALDNAQLSVRAGTVHALMGENGAGKSTLMKCLFGIYSKDAGHIYLDGKEIDFKSSREALDNGVAMVHQELNQALKRTVMDNIWLGRYPLVKKGLPFVSDKQSYNDTKKVFDDLGINVNPRTVMSTMPVSQPIAPERWLNPSRPGRQAISAEMTLSGCPRRNCLLAALAATLGSPSVPMGRQGFFLLRLGARPCLRAMRCTFLRLIAAPCLRRRQSTT